MLTDKEKKHLFPNGGIIEIGSDGDHKAFKLISPEYDYNENDTSEGLLKLAKKNQRI